MKKDKKLLYVLVIVLISNLIYPVRAEAAGLNHTIATSTYFFISDSPFVSQQLCSPLDENDTSYGNAWVNSKCNQPRDEGSNPHRGTDFAANAGDPIYAVGDGVITSCQLPYASGPSPWVVLKLTHSIDRTYYAVYMHVRATKTSGAVSKGDIIGYVESYTYNGGFAPHLHFGIIDKSSVDSTEKYYPLGGFYNDFYNWDYGARLDFIKPYYAYSKLFIRTYASDENSYLEEVMNVEINYSVNDSSFKTQDITSNVYGLEQIGPWGNCGKDRNGDPIPGHNCSGRHGVTYYFDFASVANPGDKIEWYVRVYRDNLSTSKDYSFFPYYGDNLTAETFFLVQIS